MKKNTHRLKANKRRRELAKRLTGYSLAAGAALAGAQSAEAGIIYSSTIPGWQSVVFGPGDEDVTLEGANADLRLIGSRWTIGTTSPYYTFQGVAVGGPNGASVQTLGSVLEMLGKSSNVGPSGVFWSYSTAWYRSAYNGSTISTSGSWTYDGQVGFFGFKFALESNGTTVYGWGELKRLTADSGELLRWAYEDSGDPIHVADVPEPSGLALLALGAGGLAAWRSRRRKKEA